MKRSGICKLVKKYDAVIFKSKTLAFKFLKILKNL